MGLRFRKSISFGKFFRLNLSKSGVSLGMGPRGLNVNIGPRGVRQTVGLPGTGLYYQESHQWPKSPETVPLVNSPTESGSGLGLKIIGIVVVTIALVAFFGGGSSTTASRNVAAIPKAVTPPQVKPPTPDRVLNRDEVVELQILLRKQGFNPGKPDGVIGPRTRVAALAFAKAHQADMLQTGPSLRLLEVARGH